jgi:tetratricopeptide (TPR) repeat protein
MPIQRPSEREQRPSALDVFTDREELIAAFERNLAHKQPQDNRVLVFYGDGGIGKTTLLQKLEQLHCQRCPQALMGRLDLAGADTTPPDLLLYRLRRLFPTIPFPSFSLALAEYGRRFHPEQVYGSDRKELLQGAGPYADVLAGGLEVLGQLSGVWLAVSTMKAAATAQRQLSDWVQRRAEPWLQRSQSYSEEQLLDQLPRQWARDFRQALSSQLEQDWDDAITYSGPPPLIALDTYETLWHSGMGKSGRRREPRERWLVDLVSELPEVLWLIGGRDRLSWEEGYDQGWSEACEQHLIGQLSEEDARSFLAKRGIKEPAIVEKILRQAAGVPFYLELETQLYDKTPAAERTPEVFGGSQREQIERLLTHLDASERATLKLLAAFGIWDRELFSQAVTHFATGYPATGAAELGRFWSIEPIGADRWQLHNEMAHHLQADECQRDQGTFEAVHHWGFSYFDGPLEGLEAKAIQADDSERLQRALRHARVIQPPAEWAAWLVKRLEQLGEGTIWQSLLAVAERGVQEAAKTLAANDPAVAGLLDRQATLLHEIAQYEDAEPLFRRALAIDEASYGNDHPNVARDLNNLASLLHDTNRLEEAEPMYRRALAIDEASYGHDHPNEAIRLNDLAQLLKTTNRLAEAEPLMRRALEIDEASYGNDHPEVATDLNNLALLLQATNRLAEAEPLYLRALAIDEASYGNHHPKVATRLNNLALLLQATTRLAEAEPLMRRALAIDEGSYGNHHPKVATRLNNLAQLLKTTNRLAEAEPLMRRALAIDEGSYGNDHPEVATDLNNLAQLLKATNRLAEAEPLSRRASWICLASLGRDHPYTQKGKENYLKILQAQSLTETEIEAKLAAFEIPG